MTAFDGNGYTPRRRLPDQWTIRLLYPRPPRGLSANDRVHYMAKDRAVQAVRLEVMTKVRALKLPPLERIRIEIVWWVTDNRRRDVDNVFPLAKACYDGIAADKGTSAKVVDDDTPGLVEKVMPRIERLPKGGNAHFEVRITDLGDAL